MAFFGRKPKKPGTVPGSQSGFTQQARVQRAARVVTGLADEERPGRPTRVTRGLRAARTIRSGRSAR